MPPQEKKTPTQEKKASSEKKPFHLPENLKLPFHLNLFDTVILALAVIVGLVLLWNLIKPAPKDGSGAPGTQTIRYVVQYYRWQEGDSSRIVPGTTVEDGIKNYRIGKVVDVKAVPATALILNQVTRKYEIHTLPGLEDVLVTMEAQGTFDDRGVNLDNGFLLRVGETIYGRGEGYMGIGPAISIEREVKPS